MGLSRRDVIARWGSVCHLCDEPIDLNLQRPHPDAFTRDHVKPVAFGGDHVLDNLRPAHWVCNVKRQETSVEEGRRRAQAHRATHPTREPSTQPRPTPSPAKPSKGWSAKAERRRRAKRRAAIDRGDYDGWVRMCLQDRYPPPQRNQR